MTKGDTHGLSGLLSLDWSEGILAGTRTKSSVSSGLELLPCSRADTGDPAAEVNIEV